MYIFIFHFLNIYLLTFTNVPKPRILMENPLKISHFISKKRAFLMHTHVRKCSDNMLVNASILLGNVGVNRLRNAQIK